MDIALSFAALLGLSLFFSSLRGVNSALAPLLSLSTIILWLSLTGMADLLLPGGWILYLLCLGAGGWQIYKHRKNLPGYCKKIFSPGFVLWVGGGLLLWVYFALRQPVFSQWDEFVSWGVAPKLTLLNHRLYPTADQGFFWTITERPALVLLSYFTQFFSAAFMPWKLYWVYALLFFACGSALLSAFDWKDWKIALPLGVTALILPFFFEVAYHTVELKNTYLSAYADIPGGMLFGGALVVWFSLRQSRQPVWWPALLPLACLTLVKENVVPIALVAAGIMMIDCLFFTHSPSGFYAIGPGGEQSPQPKLKTRTTPRQWGLRLGVCALLGGTVGLAYILWSRYATWAHVTYNTFMRGNSTNEPFSQSLRQVGLELTGQAPMPAHAQKTIADLVNMFLGRAPVENGYVKNVFRVSMAGSSLVTVLLITGIFIAAALLMPRKRAKIRVGLVWFLLFAGYVAYHFMLFVVYAYFSHTRRDVGVFDYTRYVATYHIGWCMLGLLFLALAAKWNRGKKALAGRSLLLLLAFAMMFRAADMLRPGYTVLDYPSNAFDQEKKLEQQALDLAGKIQKPGRIFFVSQEGDGGEYMQWHYHFLPKVIDYSITGGSPLAPPPQEVRGLPPQQLEVEFPRQPTAEMLEEHLETYDCQYILIQSLDSVFTQEYAEIFETPLAEDLPLPALFERNAQGKYFQIA